ncbi:hypothetical protein Lepto7376_1438 [[Leptolyngbya] sp. PCC 7376]|uniref:hypothetical protein n=1 Tax=[Leptolyngbya] sp. PCC 7376 TaxID=111781 RepID=UPI00029EE869|nr:hypothetical protein [[Leptolyngbya] sp. PCC 7376]AFY37782.1 hypothetical protein Lepto7376_1438 [[Leptolyngbya] sp. PCC 7376]
MARPKHKFLKRIYQKEPISSFLIVMGLIQLVIGGVDSQWNLFSLGFGLVLGAFFVRWSQTRKHRLESERVLPRRYLSPSKSPRPLPRWDDE